MDEPKTFEVLDFACSGSFPRLERRRRALRIKGDLDGAVREKRVHEAVAEERDRVLAAEAGVPAVGEAVVRVRGVPSPQRRRTPATTTYF